MAGVGLYQLQTEQFSGNLQLRLQQQMSRVRGKTLEGNHVGKQAAIIDYVSPVSMKPVNGRNSFVEVSDNDYSRRWVVPVPKDLTQRVNTFDKLLTVEDPQSQLVRGAGAAVSREWDDRVIAAAFGTAQISNTDGTTLVAETWAQAQNGLTGSNTGLTIADDFGNASTTIGMTVDKMIEGRRLFKHYHVADEEMQVGDFTAVIGSQQEADMMKLVEITSAEFNSQQILQKGSMDGQSFMGWNYIVSERLQFGADPVSTHSNCRQCIFFVKTGLYLGIWLDSENIITRETLIKGAPWQIYTMMSSGGTRLEPGRVLQVSCGNDTSGADNV